MNTWQPIATAPRDGTVIDVWYWDARITDVFWHKADVGYAYEGWMYYNVTDWDRLDNECITHWMPLPESPT